MSETPKTPTGECRHCRKDIRRNAAGIWGARRRNDPHPWYCAGDPRDGKRHQPADGVQ